MIYFLVSPDGTMCKIGHAVDVVQRYKSHRSSFPWEFYAAICGSRENEQAIHRHFAHLAIPGVNEQFYLRDELRTYLEWLGTRAYAACSLEELPKAYPAGARFPWTEHAPALDSQLALDGIDQLVPGLRKPLAESARVLATIRSDSDEWYTPPIYVEAAREVMGAIDLDPATSALANRVVRATEVFTSTEDGLRYEWRGRVWMNPPYGNEKDQFVTHLLAEHEAGRVEQAVMCLNAHATDTIWFQVLWQYPICFTHHRPRFVGGQRNKSVDEVAPTTGIVFVYVGPHRERFAKTFSAFGAVVHCEDPPSTVDAALFRRLQEQGDDWNMEP